MAGDRPASWAEYDARLATAMFLFREDMTEAELNALRRSIGTLSPVSKYLGEGQSKASRFLWRLFDVGETAAIPAILILLPALLLLGAAAIAWMAGL